jgi:hypothetical protein
MRACTFVLLFLVLRDELITSIFCVGTWDPDGVDELLKQKATTIAGSSAADGTFLR